GDRSGSARERRGAARARAREDASRDAVAWRRRRGRRGARRESAGLTPRGARIAGDPAPGAATRGRAARRRDRRARARTRPRGVVKLEVEPAVAAAIAAKRAVVALESTVIAHGLPRPLNLE